jgi:hypothetical protein
VPFGRRAIVDKGIGDLKKILHEEATGKYINRFRREIGEQENILIIGKY